MNFKEEKKCFEFFKSDSYPNGAIKITKENVLKLKELGWEVDFHTDYYLNFLGCNYNGLEIGFSCWMENLDINITTPDGGWLVDITKLENEEKFNLFIDIICNFILINKNKDERIIN